jgi:peptidoglycan-associated lipoprotein
MKRKIIQALIAFAVSTTLASCYRSRCEMWEDTKTCSRYMGKGIRSLFGSHVDSREYARFYESWEDDEHTASNRRKEFIPLADSESEEWPLALKEYPLSKESPGDPGSKLPGIEKFMSPAGPLAAIFNNVHFDTDSYTVKGSENVAALRMIASYLANHPATYVFVEGHADQRGAAAYNLALGSRRANAVRAFLIENGANPDQLLTISYGLERPIASGHDESAWRTNRRAQFKLYNN